MLHGRGAAEPLCRTFCIMDSTDCDHSADWTISRCDLPKARCAVRATALVGQIGVPHASDAIELLKRKYD